MRKVNVVTLVVALGSALGAGSIFASNDPAAAGRVLSASGGVLIQRSVQTDNANIGTIIGVGDTVLTTDTGTAQWVMSDDSLFALAPDAGFKINKYMLPSARNADGVASYTLLRGAVHTVTGKIGKGVAAGAVRNIYTSASGRFNPANLIKVTAAPTGPYTLKTALAVITSKGADMIASQEDKALKVLVTAGSVQVCTIAGCATSAPGEGVVVGCSGCKPTTVSVASLGLESVVAGLEFKTQATPEQQQDEQNNDPRTQLVSPTQACRTVIARLQGGASCQNADHPDVPVSPN